MQDNARVQFILHVLLLLFVLSALTRLVGGQSAVLHTSSTGTTQYGSYVGGGSIVKQSSSQTSPLPLINDVLNQNAQNAQWLITCPSQPDPLNTMEYFTTNDRSFILGNRCLTDASSLQTTAVRYISVTWTSSTPAYTTSVNVVLQNAASGRIDNLAYSGSSEMNGNGNYNISNGHDTESYIFGQVPPATQYGLWTWHVKYTDLSNIDLTPLQQDQQIPGLQVSVPYSACVTPPCKDWCPCIMYYWTCSYIYEYIVNAKVLALDNSQIPVPVQAGPLSSDNYLLINNFPYSPFTGGSTGDCSMADLYIGNPCPGWTKVSGDGTLVLPNGKKYYYLNVYTTTLHPDQYWTVYTTGAGFLGWLGFNLNAGYVPLSTLQYGAVGALPYLLYNVSLPATLSVLNGREEYLNLSFDIYSPHNYLDPSSSLEPFPLFTDSGIFAAYGNGDTKNLGVFPSNALSLADPNINSLPDLLTSFLSSLTQSQLQGLVLDTVLGKARQVLGSYVSGVIANPIYLSAAPNDYLYALTSAQACTFWVFGCSQDVYLYTMRFIPVGYFNLLNNQPNTLGPVYCTDLSTCADTWNSMWNGKSGYWASALLEQSQNLYITSIYHISDKGSSFWTSGNWRHDTQTSLSMAPIAITTDYNNDVFMLGACSGLNANGDNCNSFKLAEMIPGAGGGNYIYTATSTPSPFIPSGELAADPSGQYVYVAGDSSGNILIYGAPPTSYFVYMGDISLSYSNPGYNFNVVAYLANGGPFGNSRIASAYSNIPGSNDVPSNHHPIAISDYKGFLYVIDNWTFSVDGKDSSILMLRAFTENGVEIPIDGSAVNYLVPVPGDQQSNPRGTATATMPTGGWAPYGWPLSTNITISSASPTSNEHGFYTPHGDGVYVSYCAAGCSYTPTSPTLTTHYKPIGPIISIDGTFLEQNAAQAVINSAPQTVGASNGFGFYTDFNGTSYLIAHAYAYGDIGGKSTYWTDLIGNGRQLYTEMLSFRLNLVNYTTISLGADSPYACYIDTQYPNTPCIYDSSGTISNIFAPMLGVPSSFSYVESQGSPQQFFSLSTLISSLFPSGVPSGQGAGSAAQQNIAPSCSGGGTPTCTASGDSPTCASASVSCTNGGTPSCSSGSATCSVTSSNIYCSNGSNPTCSGASGTPECSLSQQSVPDCSDGSKLTCPSTTAGGTPGTAECNPQVQPPSCTSGGTLTCPDVKDASGAAVSGTAQCTSPACWPSGSAPQCTSGTPQCLPSSFTSSGTPPPATSFTNTYVNSIIAGYLLVPYHYQYQLTQTYSPNPAPGYISSGYPYPGYYGCPDYSFQPSTGDVQTVYTAAQVNIKSKQLMDVVQGGGTYLELQPYNRNYYTANLSDAGAIVSPDLNYNIYTSRWFGGMFVNQTISPSASQPAALPSAEIMNAVMFNNYRSESFTQQSSFGTSFAYMAQDVIPLSSPVYGAVCGSSCLANYYYNPSGTSSLASTLAYSNAIQTTPLPLFQLFEQASYLYNLNLDLSQNQNVLGYNRLVYTFVDSFDNIITVPLDADLANIASVAATVQTVTNPENANETNVIVIGTAMYSLPSGMMQPLPTGSKIYLYYDANLNYYDSVISPADNPARYYQYALQCAFSTSSSVCQLANPLSTLTQPGSSGMPQTSGPSEADVLMFKTQYNYNSLSPEFSSPPSCAAPPKSLLDLPGCILHSAACECNIYGNYGLSTTRQPFNNPAAPMEYCVPAYQNGNGMFTSQLGLIAVVDTRTDGTFNSVFTTCGSGSKSVIAQYYGYPPPEPVPVSQPSLQYSANVIPPDSSYVIANEFNYAYSPASLSIPINIGSYALSFGGIDAATLTFASLALLLFRARRTMQK